MYFIIFRLILLSFASLYISYLFAGKKDARIGTNWKRVDEQHFFPGMECTVATTTMRQTGRVDLYVNKKRNIEARMLFKGRMEIVSHLYEGRKYCG